jgi:hypothetical protein
MLRAGMESARLNLAFSLGKRCYSGLFSEVPEKAATMAGLITMRTKVRPIRRSCIGGISSVGFVRTCPQPKDDSSNVILE